MGSNSETQGYNFYPMLLFRRKFSNGITPIPQSKILQREYRKRELAILFSFWSVFILTRYCDYVTMW